MASDEESFVVLVHYKGSIKRKTRSGVKFTDKDLLSIFMRLTMRFDEFLNSIIQKLGLQGTVASSNSRHVGASSSVPVNAPRDEPVASSSFVVDLNCSGGREVGIVDRVPISLQCGTPAGMGDALMDDDDDDYVEPDLIADDSGDALQRLDAMRQEGVLGEPTGFGARDTQGTGGLAEFQDKKEAVLSVKTYSIRCVVRYKVVESNYHMYVGKCTEFGNGCTWLIRLSF
ncbi:hypothetical protein Ahy_A03g014505 isoform A [Arachis hypogaea]|uniref:Transposase MuDR plant domain-containing protein n=1 Tax=Arachis hypogaea TaxID=3818 RepID=A0A445DY90_ARAHY|nr:hypothetical protein Ahy_A03g014505 isoform A [Arachis hypogaea]